MTRKLQDHMEFVESFASDISHEFRNPLASIRSAAEMVGQAPSAEDRDRFLRLIQKEVERMQHLLGGVREISLIDAQLEDEERSPVDVAEIVKQIVEGYKLRGASQVTVQILEQTSSFTVSISPGRLSQILENLLDNALSFANTGVRISLARVRGKGMIVFEDDGPGIPEQHLEKIFDRFFSYRHTQKNHLGLGLSIVKAVVQGYGGRVTADNGAKGARFTVWLPLQ
jgi:two-component system sensor histidine kinase ChvG